MRIRRGIAAMLVTVVGATGAACTPPPTGGPSGPCSGPNQVLEPADPSLFSLPHAISANGQRLVTSRTVGEDYQLSVRTTAPSDTGSIVTTVPRDGLRGVAITDDGSALVMHRLGVLERIDTSTGVTTSLAPPALPLPDGATIQSVTPLGFSEDGFLTSSNAVSRDGERIAWTRDVHRGVPFEWDSTAVVTDLDSGDVVWEGPGWSTISPSMTAAAHSQSPGSVGGTEDPRVWNFAAGTSSSLAPARAALSAAGIPVSLQSVLAVSDDGRYVVYRATLYTDNVPDEQLHLWDVLDQSMREVPLPPGWEVARHAEVDDRGRILFYRLGSPSSFAYLWDPATDAIGTLAATLYEGWGGRVAFHATPDLTRSVTSVQRTTPPLGVEMRLISCP